MNKWKIATPVRKEAESKRYPILNACQLAVLKIHVEFDTIDIQCKKGKKCLFYNSNEIPEICK